MDATTYLFVYGTLMRGESNHQAWLSDARFVGDDRTTAAFTLLDFGDYPGLVRGGDQSVIGERYLVTDDQLVRLDILEECPDVYVREQVRLSSGLQAWVYLMREDLLDGGIRIKSGDWRLR